MVKNPISVYFNCPKECFVSRSLIRQKKDIIKKINKCAFIEHLTSRQIKELMRCFK